MEAKFELHHDLQDASLEKACETMNTLATCFMAMRKEDLRNKLCDVHYLLEYLRLNFDLVPKK